MVRIAIYFIFPISAGSPSAFNFPRRALAPACCREVRLCNPQPRTARMDNVSASSDEPRISIQTSSDDLGGETPKPRLSQRIGTMTGKSLSQHLPSVEAKEIEVHAADRTHTQFVSNVLARASTRNSDIVDAAAAQALFEKFDVNSDGTIDAQEVQAMRPMPQAARRAR